MLFLYRNKIQKGKGGYVVIAVDKLRGIIAERGMSQRQVAAGLGMTEKTFYSKMKKGVFDSAEMSAMIEMLNIQNPSDIFFAELVS